MNLFKMPLFVNPDERQPLRQVERPEDPVGEADQGGVNGLEARPETKKLRLDVTENFQRVESFHGARRAEFVARNIFLRPASFEV